MNGDAPETAPVAPQGTLMPRTADELREVEVGEIAAVPRAPASGNINVPDGTPVALVVQDFFKNKTIRLALALIAGAFAFFLGYVADEVLQTKTFFGEFPWYVDVLIICGTGSGIIALVYFWDSPLLVKIRKAIITGFAGFFGYVGWTIVNSNGLDGIDWHKTMHVAINTGIAAAVGGILLISKLTNNNPVNGPRAK